MSAQTILKHKLPLVIIAVTLLITGIGLGLIFEDVEGFVWRPFNDNAVVIPSQHPMDQYGPPPQDSLRQLTVELPLDEMPIDNESGGPENDQALSLVVRIEAAGRVTFMGQLMDLEQFRTALQSERDYVNEDVMVTIIPQANVEYRSIRKVMDVCEECSVPAYRVGRRNRQGSSVGTRVGPAA